MVQSDRMKQMLTIERTKLPRTTFLDENALFYFSKGEFDFKCLRYLFFT